MFSSPIPLLWWGSYITTIQGFRESRDVFLHNLDECYSPSPTSFIPISIVPSSNNESQHEHSELCICHANEGVGPSMYGSFIFVGSFLFFSTSFVGSFRLSFSGSLLGPCFLSFVGSFQLTNLAHRYADDGKLFSSGNTGHRQHFEHARQGQIKEAQGIIQGRKSTYYIIKSLQGGCQSACFLVSTEKEGGDCFYAAKVRTCLLYLEFNLVSTRSRLLLGPNEHNLRMTRHAWGYHIAHFC
jgi:hypothetical protein